MEKKNQKLQTRYFVLNTLAVSILLVSNSTYALQALDDTSMRDVNAQDGLNVNLDFKEVNEDYTIYHYQKDCREKIKEIQSRNKTPIIVGGTGLYIKAALYDYKLTEEKETNTYDNLTDEELYNKLLELDKDIVIDKNNRRRLIRAINYYGVIYSVKF